MFFFFIDTCELLVVLIRDNALSINICFVKVNNIYILFIN